MKKILQKKLNRRGFSLMETLLSVFILVLLSLILVIVLNTAISTYKETIYNTNSDILLTNIRTVLRTELADAKSITVTVVKDDTNQIVGHEINYVEGKTGAVCKIYNGEKGIMLSKYEEDLLLVTPSENLISEFSFGTVTGKDLEDLNQAIVTNESITIPEISVHRVKSDDTVVRYATTENYYIGNR